MNEISEIKNILIVRTDRIGDLVLSTPVFQAVKENYPNARLTVLASSYAAPFLKTNPYIDEVIDYDSKRRFKGLAGTRKLSVLLALKKFDISLVLQTNFFVALALYLAKIPIRIGPKSKLHSYFFYNDGIVQHRSRVEMHEADYNLQLLSKIGIQTSTLFIKPKVWVDDQTLQAAAQFLKEKNLSEKPLVILHPGMGHSALNWPKEHYLELGKRLSSNSDISFLMTFGPDEAKIAEPFKSELQAGTYEGEKGLLFLAALYKLAKLVIAPSTGPLHIANAVGTKVMAFYPPVKVQSVLRWGPVDQFENTLVPDVNCAEDYRCAGTKCMFYYCMRSIYPAEAYQKAMDILEKNKSTSEPINTYESVKA